MKIKNFAATLGLFVAIIASYQLGRFAEREDIQVFSRQAHAQEAPGAAKARGHYYPGTEELRSDEMRVISPGTGMPTPRPSQAASCWLVELGNGEKFLFDLGAMTPPEQPRACSRGPCGTIAREAGIEPNGWRYVLPLNRPLVRGYDLLMREISGIRERRAYRMLADFDKAIAMADHEKHALAEPEQLHRDVAAGSAVVSLAGRGKAHPRGEDLT